MSIDNVLVNITRDILGEMIRQTDILEALKLQETGDIAIAASTAYDMPVIPEITLYNGISSVKTPNGCDHYATY